MMVWLFATCGYARCWRGGETATYKDFRESCRDMANSLGFEGHIAGAETMP
jgi:hypothetical protein